MIVPPEQLNADVLRSIIESFITREGTDYGEQEWSLEEKVEQLLPQVLNGEVAIVYDEASESITLMERQALPPQ
ncbi:YheU family protein [Teredinibacter waterburyi]|jgi:Uncharacterized protein conserved in bacteria|uniref:YheU family protein n=1 Tax=Teredinibacter waterburyi TaxID=1500538 RepID=UPI0016600551|nr:YheU family protein [Teredinibacter waterburyi]